MEFLRGCQQRQRQVPQLVFLEESGVEALAVMYLVAEDEGVVLEDELR